MRKEGSSLDEKIIKALGDPKRYGLLRMMSESGYCVGALASRSGLSESAVSQHLKILREAGLVYGEKYGYYTHYSVDKAALGKIIAELTEMLNMDRSLYSLSRMQPFSLMLLLCWLPYWLSLLYLVLS
jgi:ArsR family transcriptional regulator